MNEKFDFLPLGSIVVVSGGIKKFVIVARALQVNINGCKQLFDYAACPYPEGMNGDRLMYFQHTDISRVVFEGYVDCLLYTSNACISLSNFRRSLTEYR